MPVQQLIQLTLSILSSLSSIYAVLVQSIGGATPETAYHFAELGAIVFTGGMAYQKVKVGQIELGKLKKNLHTIYTSLLSAGIIKSDTTKWEE